MNEPEVATRLAQLRRHVLAQATRGEVGICAVTKGFAAQAIVLAQRLGCDAIGENYAQEAVAKLAEVGDARPPVHFIGRLQSNKIRTLVPYITVWQSIDRDSLVDELAKRAPGARMYVQVNATGEPDKGGCAPGATTGLVARAQLAGLVVEGLMTVGPTEPNPTRALEAFTAVRQLADDNGLHHCSMGMSDDLDEALAAGTTLVRVGTALFGPRPGR